MAWILHILVSVTVMSTTAHKYRHNQDFAPGSRHREHYQEPSHEQMFVRSTGNEPNRMSERSILVHSPVQYIHDERRLSSGVEGIPRVENGSYRILNSSPNRYPPIINRRGQAEEANKDRVVFPGPIATRRYEPEVSEECKKIGICEDVPNYPEEHVSKIIAQLGDDVKKFQKDELDIPDTPDIAQRLGPAEDSMELCSFRERIIFPRAAPDKDNNWYTVINQKENPLQGFRVEICDTSKTSCADFASFQTGYEGRCVQKYVRRPMAILDMDGKMTEMSLKVPSCCSCLARVLI